MAGFDVFNDTTPHQDLTPERRPSIEEYKAAIGASDVAGSYDLQSMTLNDLRGICRVHGISVPVNAPEAAPEEPAA